MKPKQMPRSLAIGLLATMLAIAGCSRAKEDASRAVSAAETSLAAVRDDAAKYLPGELQGVESSLAALKDSLAKGDYKAVLANVPAVTAGIDSLKSDVAGKAEQTQAAAAEWGSYSTDVPQMMTALQSRVDTLAKSKRYPKGLDASSFAAVQGDLQDMKADWEAAMNFNTSGSSIEAVAKARSAKATGERLLQQLGMSAG